VWLSSASVKIAPEMRLIGAGGSALGDVTGTYSSPTILVLTVPDLLLRRTALFVEMETKNHGIVTAIVHHPIELAALAQSDNQRALRNALDSLETDTPLIEELMRVVEKVIFDEQFTLTSSTRSKKAQGKLKIETEKVQEEFSIGLDKTKRQLAAMQTLLSSGDLGALLDALIHQLGMGLEAGVGRAPSFPNSEEDLIGSDDEGLLNLVMVNPDIDLVGRVQKKVKTVLRRMIRQLENVADSQDSAIRALIQTAGVLAIIHRLCRVTSDEAKWMPRDETLVPEDARYNFFLDASRLLYSKNGVMKRALEKLDNHPFQELSLVRGLLVWLAWDCDFHVQNPVDFEETEDVEENILGLARLLSIAEDLSDDGEALAKGKLAIESSTHQYDPSSYDSDWFEKFVVWSLEINGLLNKQVIRHERQREPAPGDIVFADKPPHLFVVAQAFHGKVRLVDFDSENDLKTFSASYVTIAKPAF
jgi:hypothetical protein